MEPGDTLGRYEIHSLIARGGMAEVWLAISKGVGGFKKKVVLKTILPHLSENPDFIRMFINEALLAARLNHPHIVQIFDLGSIKNHYFIAMEYVPGRSIRQLSRRCRRNNQRIPPWFILRSLVTVCEALQYAHDLSDEEGRPLGLIHRDVTPENIMISFAGSVKVLDFGVAKATSAASVTKAGTLKGKYSYISPEQIRGQPADRRSDIYSIGVILYEMLTGTRPFKGENDLALLRKVVRGNPIPPRQISPWLPEPLEAIILKALSVDVEKRHCEVGELGEEILTYLNHIQDRHSQRELSLYVSSLFPDEPNIPSDVLKRLSSGGQQNLESRLFVPESDIPTTPVEQLIGDLEMLGSNDIESLTTRDQEERIDQLMEGGKTSDPDETTEYRRDDSSTFAVTGLEGKEIIDSSLLPPISAKGKDEKEDTPEKGKHSDNKSSEAPKEAAGKTKTTARARKHSWIASLALPKANLTPLKSDIQSKSLKSAPKNASSKKASVSIKPAPSTRALDKRSPNSSSPQRQPSSAANAEKIASVKSTEKKTTPQKVPTQKPEKPQASVQKSEKKPLAQKPTPQNSGKDKKRQKPTQTSPTQKAIPPKAITQNIISRKVITSKPVAQKPASPKTTDSKPVAQTPTAQKATDQKAITQLSVASKPMIRSEKTAEVQQRTDQHKKVTQQSLSKIDILKPLEVSPSDVAKGDQQAEESIKETPREPIATMGSDSNKGKNSSSSSSDPIHRKKATIPGLFDPTESSNKESKSTSDIFSSATKAKIASLHRKQQKDPPKKDSKAKPEPISKKETRQPTDAKIPNQEKDRLTLLWETASNRPPKEEDTEPPSKEKKSEPTFSKDKMAALWDQTASTKQEEEGQENKKSDASSFLEKADLDQQSGSSIWDHDFGSWEHESSSSIWDIPSSTSKIVDGSEPIKSPLGESPRDPDEDSTPGFTTGVGPPPSEPVVPDIFHSRRPLSEDGDEDIFTSFKSFRREDLGLERSIQNIFPGASLQSSPKKLSSSSSTSWGGERPGSKAAQHFDEGLALMKKGAYVEALEQWNRALSLDPNNKVYQSNLKLLNKLISESNKK